MKYTYDLITLRLPYRVIMTTMPKEWVINDIHNTDHIEIKEIVFVPKEMIEVYGAKRAINKFRHVYSLATHIKKYGVKSPEVKSWIQSFDLFPFDIQFLERCEIIKIVNGEPKELSTMIP